MTDTSLAADTQTAGNAITTDPAAATQAVSDAAAAAAATIGAGAGGADAGAATPWWQDARFSDAERTLFTAKGLTVDDPVAAAQRLAQMQINAERRLGMPADRLVPLPAEGQDAATWLREHRAKLGLPETADGYQIDRPHDWPADAPWNADLEAKARAIALEEGVTPNALKRLAATYAAEMATMTTSATAAYEAAKSTMMADLQRDWGPQMDARIARAQSAAQTVSQALGLDPEGMATLAQSLKPSLGDAGVLRLFDWIAEGAQGDSAPQVGRSASVFGTSRAEAEAQLAKMRAPGGEYFEAMKASDTAALARLKPTIDNLTRIAVGE